MATAEKITPASGLEISGSLTPAFEDILSDAAKAFVAELAERFTLRRDELLARRKARQARFDAGEKPDFLAETTAIRAADWQVTSVPADLMDRRVEITGPVDRKMIINALNSGARVFMADLEDAHSPTWEATIQGQINLRDAVEGKIEFTNPRGKRYVLNDKVATLMVRPRGWHLEEKHACLNHHPIPAALFDFGLYLFHNGKRLLSRDSGPYFYLPKMESHLEARLWNDVFRFSEEMLDIPRGSIKATVLIETLPAAFEMDEILYELRDYIIGLNCGRWDYIFSFIKCFQLHAENVLPDRAMVTMTTHFMHSYSRLLIKTCHHRGAYAIGGMAAQIPIKDDPEANAIALEKVRKDKEREARDGHDGTWVAHPGLVPVALEVFDQFMPGPNQLERTLDDLEVTADDLLAMPAGEITENGVRSNVSAGLRYLATWLDGHGAVPIHHLMEDVATAEIARSQLWQWVRYPNARLSDGREITAEFFKSCLMEELELVKHELGEAAYADSNFEHAVELLRRLVLSEDFAEFLTLDAYTYL